MFSRRTTKKRSANTIVIVAALLLFWCLGFYPFQFGPPSGFHKTADGIGLGYINTSHINNSGIELKQDGLHFKKESIALLQPQPEWLPESIQSSSLGIDLIIETDTREQTGPARIFTISKNLVERNLTIGQNGSDLIIRLRSSKTNPNGLPSYSIKNLFSTPGKKEINLLIDRNRLKVQINGKEALLAALPDEVMSHWSPEFQLAFGNELTFDRPWLGIIYKATVTVNKQTFDYTIPGALDIPKNYKVELKKEIRLNPLSGKNNDRFNLYMDWVLNFFGFFAFGLLIMAIMGQTSSVLLATLLLAALSLSIETGQLFLLDRYPALSDLILNTLGGLSGACFYKKNSYISRFLSSCFS